MLHIICLHCQNNSINSYIIFPLERSNDLHEEKITFDKNGINYRVSLKTFPTLFSTISHLLDRLGIKSWTFLNCPRNSLLKNVQNHFSSFKNGRDMSDSLLSFRREFQITLDNIILLHTVTFIT